MNLEALISNMMQINIFARLWHWRTDSAQHHVTYENFLTENEKLTDRFVESALGNDLSLSFKKIGVREALSDHYSIDSAVKKIKDYRREVSQIKSKLENPSSKINAEELVSILDDVIELASKTLYLLKLS